jgi:uncharacterized membrane protein YoaK (UPF0700 family)
MLTVIDDVWHTIVPPEGDRHGPLAPMLLALTMVTGLVDSFSYLVLGHVFVANMTGNVVFLAFALVGAKGFSLLASFLALVAFALGSVASGRLVVHLGPRRGRILALSTACEVALVATAMILGWTAAFPGSGVVRYVLVILLAMATGVQNGAARKLAVPDLTTTVLTMTVTGIGADSVLGGGKGSKSGRRLVAVAAMFIGALIGGLLVLHVRIVIPLAIAFVVIAAVALASYEAGKTDPPWTHVED